MPREGALCGRRPPVPRIGRPSVLRKGPLCRDEALCADRRLFVQKGGPL